MQTITQRLMFAATRFPRRAQFPHGEQAMLIGAIRRLEARLGRPHRH